MACILPSVEKVILDVVDAGKIINGTREPYSPSTAGASNARALKGDAILAARRVLGSQMPEKDIAAGVSAAVSDLLAKGGLVILNPIGGKGPYR